jgi:hypothetical protein
VARKQTRRGKDVRGGALGDFAEQVGTLLGQAESRWRSWQGPETREAIVETVKDVRDRASALLKEMGAALPLGATAAGAGKAAARKRRKAAKPAGSARKTASRQGTPRKGAGGKSPKASKQGVNRSRANGR